MTAEKKLNPIFLLEEKAKDIDWKNLSKTAITDLDEQIVYTVNALKTKDGRWDAFQMNRLESVLDGIGNFWEKIPSAVQIARLLHTYYQHRAAKSREAYEARKAEGKQVAVDYSSHWTTKAAAINQKYLSNE